MDARAYRSVFLLTATCVVFRCDAVLLLAPIGAHMLWTRAFSIPRAVDWGFRCAAACLAATVAVDTAMWAPRDASDRSAFSGRWPGSDGIMWPEGRVFWFNTYENRSGEFGTSPWWWYFGNALPRSLTFAFPCAAAGVLRNGNETNLFFFVAFFFVAAYSALPHKELRFVFPAVPLFNSCAAVFLANVQRDFITASRGAERRAGEPVASRNREVRRGRAFRRAALVVFVCAGGASVATHFAFASAAVRNYPGGEAFARVHAMARSELIPARGASRGGRASVRVHVSAAAAMSGVSRFGERGSGAGDAEVAFEYSKREDLREGHAFLENGFDILINDRPNVPGYEVVRVAYGYAGTRFTRATGDSKYAIPFFPTPRSEPKIWTHRRLARDPRDAMRGDVAGEECETRNATLSLIRRESDGAASEGFERESGGEALDANFRENSHLP